MDTCTGEEGAVGRPYRLLCPVVQAVPSGVAAVGTDRRMDNEEAEGRGAKR